VEVHKTLLEDMAVARLEERVTLLLVLEEMEVLHQPVVRVVLLGFQVEIMAKMEAIYKAETVQLIHVTTILQVEAVEVVIMVAEAEEVIVFHLLHTVVVVAEAAPALFRQVADVHKEIMRDQVQLQ